MSRSKRNFWSTYFAWAALTIASATLVGCAQPTTEQTTRPLTVSPGVTLTNATYWTIAPNGTTTTGTLTVGNSANVFVIIQGLPAGSGYQLIVSGVASDGVTGCTGSSPFSSPAPSIGVKVALTCAGPPAAGQALVTSAVNSCPIIDGVGVDTASVEVGHTMALEVTAHDPDSGPAVLTYLWSADGGSLAGATSSSASLTCTQPGTVNISVTASDGDHGCDASLSFTVTCSEP
jgi:PKD domain